MDCGGGHMRLKFYINMFLDYLRNPSGLFILMFIFTVLISFQNCTPTSKFSVDSTRWALSSSSPFLGDNFNQSKDDAVNGLNYQSTVLLNVHVLEDLRGINGEKGCKYLES